MHPPWKFQYEKTEIFELNCTKLNILFRSSAVLQSQGPSEEDSGLPEDLSTCWRGRTPNKPGRPSGDDHLKYGLDRDRAEATLQNPEACKAVVNTLFLWFDLLEHDNKLFKYIQFFVFFVFLDLETDSPTQSNTPS